MIKNCVFFRKSTNEKGGILIELLLTLTIVFTIVPFLISYQKQRFERAENISIVKDLNLIRNSLEQYIQYNKTSLNSNIKNIIRINIKELLNYGISDKYLDKYQNKIQIRILKKINFDQSINLQGYIIYDDSKITPIKTKEIINNSDNKFGFIEGNKVYGAFDNWKNNLSKLDINTSRGIVNLTNNFIDNSEKYIWRIESENKNDSTMLSDINLNYHNIVNNKFVNSFNININNKLYSKEIITKKLEFQNPININQNLLLDKGVVYGSISSDNANLQINKKLNLSRFANFTNINVNDLWVINLNLYSFNASKNSIININKNMDIGNGNINTKYITVGFDGSITQRLNIIKKIEDSLNPNYYWDVQESNIVFNDILLTDLNYMADKINKSDNKTFAFNEFYKISINKNATVSDYINLINRIKKEVENKYNQLD